MKTMTIREAVRRIANALKIGEYALAEKLLSLVAGKIPNSLFVFISLGNIYAQSGRYEAAFEQYDRAITFYPASPEVYNNLGILYKNTGKLDLAVHSLEKALELAGSRPDLHYNLGNVYKELNHYEDAIAAYEKALAADPGFILTYNNLGIVYGKLGQDDKARHVYEQGLVLDPNNPGLHYNMGVIHKNQGNYRQAADDFRKALRLRPGWADAMNNYGVVLGELKKPAEAIRMFDEVLKLEPANIKALNNSGIVYAKTGEPEKAIACYRKAIKQDREYYNGLLNLGMLLEDNGYYLEALQEFAGLIKLQPYDLPVRIRYASNLIFLERYREAIDQLKFIIRQDPQHIKALRVLGSVYIRNGNFQAAAEIYNSLMKLDKVHYDFYFDLALMFSDKKDYDKSRAEVKTYLEQNPDDTNAMLLLGEIFYNQKEWDNAADLYKKLISIHPEITKSYYYLAKIYSGQEKFRDAVKVFEQLVTLQGTRAGYDDINNINASLKLYEESTARYERDLRSFHEEALLKPAGFAFDAAKPGEAEKGNPDVIAVVDSAVDSIDEMGAVDAKTYNDRSPVAEDIINKGLKEPLITVKEEEEVIDLDKTGNKTQIVELAEEPHTPLANLLDNEELYDDSPLLKNLASQQQQLESRQKELEQEMQRRKKESIEQGAQGSTPFQSSPPGMMPENAFSPPLQNLTQQPAFIPQPAITQQPTLTPQPVITQQPVLTPQPIAVVPSPVINPPPVQFPPGNNQQLPLPVNLPGSAGKQESSGDVPLIRKEALDAIQTSMQTLADLLKVKQQIIPVPVYIPQQPGFSPGNRQVQDEKNAIFGESAEKSGGVNGGKMREKIGEKIEGKAEGRNLKNQIRGFLNKVREKLETREAIEVPVDAEKKEHMIGLLDHLVQLQADLPPGALPNINVDDMRVRIEFLREKLAGKKGLKKKIEEMYRQAVKETAHNDSLGQISHTLDYIKKMVRYLPDSNLRNALAGKIDKVIRKMPR